MLRSFAHEKRLAEEQLRLVLIVSPATQFDVRRGRCAAGRERPDVVEFEERGLIAPPLCS